MSYKNYSALKVNKINHAWITKPLRKFGLFYALSLCLDFSIPAYYYCVSLN